MMSVELKGLLARVEGPATIPNHINGSRNQVESIANELANHCNSGIRNQTFTIIPVNFSARLYTSISHDM